MLISFIGLLILVGDNVTWSIHSWLPILAGVSAAALYGIANNLSKRFFVDISVFTAASGSLCFAGLFMALILPFYLPNDLGAISQLHWLYGLALGVVCTALAYVIYFKLIKSIGPTPAATVTFLIPIFSFIWGYLLLGEHVTLRMLGATVVILFGMGLVMGLFNKAFINKLLIKKPR